MNEPLALFFVDNALYSSMLIFIDSIGRFRHLDDQNSLGTFWNSEFVMILREDRTVIVDILNRGHDEGVSLEAGRIQDGDVQEVLLGESKTPKDEKVAGVLLNLNRN